MSDHDWGHITVPKRDQINADDLIGGGMTITIREVQIKGGQEQPVSILFNGSDKAFRPCKSMSRVLVAAWGPDAKRYVGRSLELYRDPNVKWGGLAVGGIRIRAMSDIDQPMTMALTETRQSRKPFTVKPLLASPRANQKHVGAEKYLSLIADCKTKGELQVFWKEFGDTIPDAEYDRVLAVFNDRLADVKVANQSAAGESELAEADAQISEDGHDV